MDGYLQCRCNAYPGFNSSTLDPLNTGHPDSETHTDAHSMRATLHPHDELDESIRVGVASKHRELREVLYPPSWETPP